MLSRIVVLRVDAIGDNKIVQQHMEMVRIELMNRLVTLDNYTNNVATTETTKQINTRLNSFNGLMSRLSLVIFSI